MVVALVLAVAFGPARLIAQEADPPAASEPVPFVVSDRTLERIRTALASESSLDLGDESLRFYSGVTVRWPTFAEYLQGTDARLQMTRPNPYKAPGERPALGAGMGVDLLGLARSAIRGFRAAQERRRAQEINEQIDRELDALERGR